MLSLILLPDFVLEHQVGGWRTFRGIGISIFLSFLASSNGGIVFEIRITTRASRYSFAFTFFTDENVGRSGGGGSSGTSDDKVRVSVESRRKTV